jgi:adenine-specific DNA-methyltransferase
MLEDLNWLSSNFDCRNGQLLFTNNRYPYILKELAEVKVGAVSGADDIFVNKVPGNLDFVYSGTLKNGDLKKMYFPIVKSEAEEILKDYKDVLISRRIKNFTEADWWQWGRGYPLNTKKRVYVNCKTRNPAPFFTSQCSNFDGSVMAIFPRNQSVNLKSFCEDLNNIDWQELGFLCDGRFLFTQRSLENCPLPEYFQKYFI